MHDPILKAAQEARSGCEACTPAFESESNLSVEEVRAKYPRFNGYCFKCGYSGILYASYEHYLAGDW